jgi:hypothetical protein
MRRRHQPVLQREVLQAKGLEEGIIGAVNGGHEWDFALTRQVPQ